MKSPLTALMCLLILASCEQKPLVTGVETEKTSQSGSGPSGEVLKIQLPAPPQSYAGTRVQTGKSENLRQQTVSNRTPDSSALVLESKARLILQDSQVHSQAGGISRELTQWYGVGAAILAREASALVLNKTVVTATAADTPGIFAADKGTTVTAEELTLSTSGKTSPGLTGRTGTRNIIRKSEVLTKGPQSPGFSAPVTGGVFQITGSKGRTEEIDSPVFYSLGKITVNQGEFQGRKSPLGLLAGTGILEAYQADLAGAAPGALVIVRDPYSLEQGARFTQTGGKFSAVGAGVPLILVDGSQGNVNFSGTKLSAASGILAQIKTAGNLTLVLRNLEVKGRLEVESGGTLDMTVKSDTLFTGAINPAGSAAQVTLTLDDSSAWVMTADSWITLLAAPDLTRIQSSGFKLHYKKDANPELNGKTIDLAGGGVLAPY